jgi:hypothetical protein
VIYWKDFVLDDVLGPIFVMPESSTPRPEIYDQSYRTEATEPGRTDTEDGARAQIQETRTEQRPARMVGLSDLDSSAQVDMDVSRSDQAQVCQSVRWRGEA